MSEAEEEEFVSKTHIIMSVDAEGNGMAQVTLDPHHGPEVIGGLLATAVWESVPSLQLRGLTADEAFAKIMQGFHSIMMQRAQEFNSVARTLVQ